MDKVDERMLLRLVADGVAEAKHIEYKRDIPTDKKEDRLEFLRDAASFANAEGGLLLYGMAEESGIPKDLPGVGSTNPDQEILRRNGDTIRNRSRRARVQG
jgi:predicted HTH transcriptional regulator